MTELQYICEMRLIALSMLFFSLFSFGQKAPATDLQLLKKGFNSEVKKNPSPSPNNLQVMNSHHKTAVTAYNPVMLILKGSMLIYQHVISPQFSAGCLYHRSCSNYAKHSIEKFGVIRGVLLTADRLTRCNRSAIREIPPFLFAPNGKAYDEPCIDFSE